jgi:hypothetical protein
MTHIRSLFILCTVLFLRGLLPVYGQQEGKFVDESQQASVPFTITRYGAKHGLPQNQVTDIVPKKNGNLIISTSNGIAEYNGTDFFSFISSKEYQNKIHYRLFWHEGTGKLYGSELGDWFNLIHPDFKLVYRLAAADLNGDTLRGIDGYGRLLKKAVTGSRFKPVMKTGILKAYTIHTENEHWYISNDKRLYYVNEKTKRTEVLIDESILAIRKNPYNGKLYAIAFYKPSIYEITGNKARKIDLDYDGLNAEGLTATDIAFVDAETWFISTTRGLLHKTRNGTVLYGDGLFPAQHLQCLYYDKREGCLFVGTVLDGLLKLQLKNCKSYYATPGVGESSTGSIVQNSKGQVFIAGSSGAIYATGPNGIYTYYTIPYQVASMSLFDDVLHVGTWGGGVLMLRDGKVIDSIPRSRISQSIHAVFKDSKGNLWLGLGLYGLAKGKDAASVRRVFPGIAESIITIYERRDGTICLGGMEHITFLSPDGKLIRQLDEKDGLICKETRSFYEDRQGKLWIGTYGGGLYCYYKNKLVSINRKKNCYFGPDAFTVAPDGKGNLLLSSNKGLWMISEKKLNAFYYGKIPYLVPFYFGEESGVWNTEFNGGMLHNYLHAADGTFWFPSIQGVVVKQPDPIIYRKLRPELRSVIINDTVHPHGDPAFSRSTHTIRFDFFCSNYAGKFNRYYQYKLNGPGLPDSWSLLQKEGTVSFKILPPGKYVFTVRAIDGFNDGSPTEKRYAFEILPYFYETYWFRVLAIVLLVFGIVSIFRYRYVRSLRKQSRESTINNTILELKLKAIQSKMDPHFIFNALNNIIYLLNAEKYSEAEELVIDFSLLLRKFLEKSDETFLSLQEELDIIDLYLLIEQRRYNQQFTYTITIDDTIAKKEIPTLLIQPLVENAIKHGISHTDRQCFINIEAYPTANGLIISVEDNGIGLQKSAEINRNRKNHLSKGIGLVREKIRIMQEKYQVDIRLEIIDLAKHEQTGTLSRLTITYHD